MSHILNSPQKKKEELDQPNLLKKKTFKSLCNTFLYFILCYWLECVKFVLPDEQILQDWLVCSWQPPFVAHHQQLGLQQWCPPEIAATVQGPERVLLLLAVRNVSDHTFPLSVAQPVAPIVVSASDQNKKQQQ